VLWRAGDELLKGVWHLEVVELPSGVISVPTSLWWTSLTTSVQPSFMAPPAGCLNKNPSFVGSEYLKLGKTGSILSVNLSALTNFKMVVVVVHNAINMGIIWKLGAKV